MSSKRKRKKKKILLQTKSTIDHTEKIEEQLNKSKKRNKQSLIGYLVLSIIFIGLVLVFIYAFFLDDIVQEANWLLYEVVTSFLLFLVLLLMAGALSIGIFIKQERKKVSTYIIALVGVVPFAMSIYALMGGVNGMLDMKRYVDGDYEIVEGIIEDYWIIDTKYGEHYVEAITIDDIEYNVSTYLSIQEAQEGLGKLRLKLHYLPYSKMAIIVEFYNEQGEVSKVINKRAPKSIR